MNARYLVYGGIYHPDYYNPEPAFGNLLRSPVIDFQPDGIDSWTQQTFTNTGSELHAYGM